MFVACSSSTRRFHTGVGETRKRQQNFDAGTLGFCIGHVDATTVLFNNFFHDISTILRPSQRQKLKNLTIEYLAVWEKEGPNLVRQKLDVEIASISPKKKL